MKKLVLTAALVLFPLCSSAAIQYDFLQKTTTEDAVTPTTDLTARATIDGERSRVEFLAGNLYPPGTYVVSTDGAHRLFFVDPTRRWYTEFNAAGVATAIGASNIKIENFKSNTTRLTDRSTIAGLDAEHWQTTVTYDITLVLRAIPLRQNVRTVIDNWTTSRYGAVAQNALAGSTLHTGNPAVDQILDAETGKVTGLPLRQQVTIKTTLDLPPIQSELKVPNTRTIMREMWVTAVREVPPDPALFVVPAGYRRADTPELPKSATETLTFEPSSK
ncbi:MAG TPA: hypothetical protein VF824_16315 [Thermoanaerobaculia bacterium]|jgi:hypothetical protein